MKINQSTAKMWSRIGSRATYGLSVLEMAKKYENFMVVTGDTSTSAGLDRFSRDKSQLVMKSIPASSHHPMHSLSLVIPILYETSKLSNPSFLAYLL